MTLGQRLRAVRLSQNWTMNELSERLEIPWSTYKSYEYETRTPAKFVRTRLERWVKRYERKL
jgi:transcriptional regulator with XRE-family HTH domain